MSVGKLKKISVSEKEYVLKEFNLSSSSESVRSIKIEDVAFSGVEPSKVVKIIQRQDCNFMYATDKLLYITMGNNLEFYYDAPITFNKPFQVLEIYLESMYIGYFVFDTGLAIYTDLFTIYKDQIQGGVSALYVKGRIIIINHGYIRVSEPFKYKKGETSTMINFVAHFPLLEFGKSVALVEIKDKVYVINQKGILYFFPGLESKDNVCEKVGLPQLDVCFESVICLNDKAYMINYNKLAVFDGTTVKTIDGLLNDFEDATFTAFSTDGLYYYANVRLSDGTEFIYGYNTITGEEVLGKYYKLICREVPYVYDDSEDKIRLISVKSEKVIKSEGSLETVEDLGTCSEKIVTGYEIHVTGSAEMVISGEFGEKVFALKDGCNTVRTNLSSRQFKFKIENPSDDFKVIKAKIKYRTCGE